MSLENTATAETEAKDAPQLSPVFEEITNIDEDAAVNNMRVRDSVLLAKSIDTLRPGTI